MQSSGRAAGRIPADHNHERRLCDGPADNCSGVQALPGRTICSAPLDIERIAQAIRGHWGVESMHWLLDLEFSDDLSRYRAGHGAKNMAVVRRFALDLVRFNKAKGSVKTRRKRASWSPAFLLEILQVA